MILKEIQNFMSKKNNYDFSDDQLSLVKHTLQVTTSIEAFIEWDNLSKG